MASKKFSFKGIGKKFWIGAALAGGGAILTYFEQHVPLISQNLYMLLDWLASLFVQWAGLDFLEGFVDQYLQESETTKYISFFINTQIIATIRNWIREFNE